MLLDRRGFVARGEPGSRWLQVQRLRVREEDVVAAVATVRHAMRRVGATVGVWWLSDRTPPGVEERLLAEGLEIAEDDYLIDGLALTSPPPPGPAGIEARAVASVEELVDAFAVAEEAFGTPLAPADPHARYEELRASAIERVYAAWVDGRLAGTGRAYFSPRGVMLAGGATAPWARGRGAYRALVRARWEDAAAAGTPVLGVHAKATSAPILKRLGFEKVLQLRRLEDVLPAL